MGTPFYKRDCECKACGKEFARAFDGKKPAKLEKRKCFCPFCGRVATTVDTRT